MAIFTFHTGVIDHSTGNQPMIHWDDPPIVKRRSECCCDLSRLFTQLHHARWPTDGFQGAVRDGGCRGLLGALHMWAVAVECDWTMIAED